MTPPNNYRKNVGLMIINQTGQVWMGKRMDADKYPQPWQMPQGGIDAGETPEQAAWRELYEETGLNTNAVQLLAESNDWICYDFPEWVTYLPFKGQCQKWFLFRFSGKDSDFNLTVHPEEIEFSEFKWVDIDDIADMIVPFKKHVYQAVVNEFKPIIFGKSF